MIQTHAYLPHLSLMNSPLEQIYRGYNAGKLDDKNETPGTGGILENERGALFASWIGTGKKVLDLGCFNGALSRYYLAGNEVTGFDIDPATLAHCPSGMKTEAHDLNGDWHKGHEGEFDVVVASEVIEHLYYPKNVLKKIDAVLKPGGLFIGSVPNAFNFKNRVRLFLARPEATPLGEPTHINQFSYAMLKKLLEQAFDNVRIEGVVQPKWKWASDLSPDLGSFILAFHAQKK